MPGPVTGILSSFTGADENPLSEGGAWSGTAIVGNNAALCQRVSNQVAITAATSRSAWNTSFAADQEAYATIPVLPGSGQGVGVFCRIQNIGNSSTLKAYAGYYHTGTGFRLFRISGTSFTQVGTTVATTLSAGDKIWLSCTGTSIVLSAFTGGSWVTKVSATDSNVTGAGLIGMEIDDATGRLDDFGGGGTAVIPSKNLMLLGAG